MTTDEILAELHRELNSAKQMRELAQTALRKHYWDGAVNQTKAFIVGMRWIQHKEKQQCNKSES